jgi:hypothetical protein
MAPPKQQRRGEYQRDNLPLPTDTGRMLPQAAGLSLSASPPLTTIMYHGKNLLLPQNRRQLAKEGWLATVLYLWTRGVAHPLFERQVSGLPDGVGTREARLLPTVEREDRALVLGTGARSMNRCPCGELVHHEL